MVISKHLQQQSSSKQNPMKKSYLFIASVLLSGISTAWADVAIYTTVSVSGCPACTVTDPTGLRADAVGHQIYGYPTGWDVWANSVDRLTVVNGIGVDFSVPSLPAGKTFNLDRLKIFGLSSRSKMTVPLTYNLVAYHPNNAIPDVVPFTIPARVVSTVMLSGYPQLKNLTKVSVSYPATSYIGKTYFIETEFTKNP